MRIYIPYGKVGLIPLDVPDETEVVYPNAVPSGDEGEILRAALGNPVDSPVFDRFVNSCSNVLVIVNDATRPTPTARVLSLIWDDLQNVPHRFIVATGVHRASTEEELRHIFGDHYWDARDRIIIHDARKEEDMVHIGTSSNGTQMYVNRAGVEADQFVIIGSVEPHYFAGYTGGRKAFLPGIASFRTIEQNHRYALRPEASALALEGNPVHDDMIDALRTISEKPIFAIMTVLDGEYRIYAATAGHIHGSFYAATDKANDVYCVPVQSRAEVVISVAPFPMDIDLYQSQKALDNGKLAMADGGILLLVSSCRDGVGEDAFLRLLSECDTPEAALRVLDEGYKLGWHKAGKMAEIAVKGSMWGYTDLDDEVLEACFIRPCHDLQEALDEALETKGPHAHLVVLMSGSMSVPKIVGHPGGYSLP
jgi:nickel-dependent lactate racemase